MIANVIVIVCCSVLLQCCTAPGHVSMCLSMSTMTDKCPDHFSLCFSLKSRYTQYKFLDLPLNPSLIVSILRFSPRHMPSNLSMLTCSSQCCECCRVRPVWCPHSLETAVTALAQPHQCHWLPSSWHGHCSCSPLQSTLSRSQTTTSTTLQHCSSNTTTKGSDNSFAHLRLVTSIPKCCIMTARPVAVDSQCRVETHQQYPANISNKPQTFSHSIHKIIF